MWKYGKRILVVLILSAFSFPILGLCFVLFSDSEAAPQLVGKSPALSTVLTDPGLWKIVLNTFILGTIATSASVIFGTLFAFLEQRTRYRGRVLMSFLTLVPLGIPSYFVAGALKSSLSGYGSQFEGLWSAVIVLTLVNTPFVQVLASSHWARTSSREEEAARSLGADPRDVFAKVTLPLVRPALVLGGILALIYIVSDFGAVAVLDAPVLTWRLYQAYETQQLLRAAALGLMSLVFLFPWFVLAVRLQGSRKDVSIQVANPVPPKRFVLSKRMALGVYFIQGVWVFFGVIIPLSMIVRWIAVGIKTNQSFAPLGTVTLTSFFYAVAGALLLLLSMGLLARFASQTTHRVGRWIETAVFLAGALPAVLIGFGLLALILQGPFELSILYGFLRQSLVLLMVGYAIKFASQGYSGTRSAFRKLDPRQEETARALGCGGPTLWKRIHLPLIAPGLTASGLLVFVMLIKELPLTLMLQPLGGQTLSYRVFDRYQEAFFHDAAAAVLVMLLMIWGTQLLTYRWRKAEAGLG